MNNNVVLISGESGTGKSTSLIYMKDDPGIVYVSCDAGKKLPFKAKFATIPLTDPMDIFDIIEQASEKEEFHTIVIDTLTYLMDMYESQYVLTSANTMRALNSSAF